MAERNPIWHKDKTSNHQTVADIAQYLIDHPKIELVSQRRFTRKSDEPPFTEATDYRLSDAKRHSRAVNFMLISN